MVRSCATLQFGNCGLSRVSQTEPNTMPLWPGDIGNKKNLNENLDDDLNDKARCKNSSQVLNTETSFRYEVEEVRFHLNSK